MHAAPVVYSEDSVIGLEIQHIVYALAAALAAYIFREVRRRRNEVRPRRPDFTIQEAWDHWRAGFEKHPDQRFFAPASPAPAEPALTTGAVERELYEMARLAAAAEDHERQVVRRMVLANATMSLVLEAIAGCDEAARKALVKGYEEGMDGLLRQAVWASRVKWMTLREYARWKFDDAVPHDWFHHYMDFAGPYVREKVRLARSHLLEADASAGRFAEVYDALLKELRDKALKVRPKRRFVPPDLDVQ